MPSRHGMIAAPMAQWRRTELNAVRRLERGNFVNTLQLHLDINVFEMRFVIGAGVKPSDLHLPVCRRMSSEMQGKRDLNTNSTNHRRHSDSEGWPQQNAKDQKVRNRGAVITSHLLAIHVSFENTCAGMIRATNWHEASVIPAKACIPPLPAPGCRPAPV